MRKALRWLLSLAVLIGTVSATGASAGAATAAEPAAKPSSGLSSNESSSEDIKDRILAIPGMSLIEEKPYPGYRFFVLNYTQPVDHRHPSKGTFQQRLTLLHKDTTRPDGLLHQRLQRLDQPRAAASRRRSSTATRSPWSTASSPRPARPPPTGRSSTSGRPPATSTASSRR